MLSPVVDASTFSERPLNQTPSCVDEPYPVLKALVKRLTARFYVTTAGNSPVRDWLLGLKETDRNIVGKDMYKVEAGWPLGMPTCRAVSNGLHEVRSTISEGKVEARVYFKIIGATMFLLHGHVGKSRQSAHVATAAERLADHEQREKARIAAEKKISKIVK